MGELRAYDIFDVVCTLAYLAHVWNADRTIRLRDWSAGFLRNLESRKRIYSVDVRHAQTSQLTSGSGAEQQRNPPLTTCMF